MAGNNITVGILRALLTLDTAQFHQGLRESGSSAKAFEGQMRKLGTNLTQLGTTLTAAITLPIVAAFGGAAKAAIDFESSFAGVRKTVDASEAEFEVMAQQFRDLAKQIPINVNDLNRLGEAAGALGIPKEEIVDFAKVMAMLGVTTNVTADQAAESIAKIQNIFGASGKNTEEFASTLVDLGNKGASTEAEILALATRIASAGNTVHMTQAQVLGFSSAIANVGMEAEAGGSAFSRVIIKMSQAVSAGGQSLQNFATIAGVSTQKFAALFKNDAAAAVDLFVKGLGKVKQGGGDLNATLTALGFKELRQSDLLRRLAGASDMVSLSLKTGNAAWAANTALTAEAEKRFATTSSQLTLLWNRFTDIGITIGNALLPMITSLIGLFNVLLPVIAQIANWFGALPGSVQLTIVGFLGLVAAIGPVLIIMGQMATAAAALSAAFMTGGIGMQALTVASTAHAAAMRGVMAVYSLFGPGMAVINAGFARMTVLVTGNSVALYASATAARIAAAAKALFSTSLVSVQAAATAVAARLGLSNAATAASGVVSRIAAASAGIFTTALSTLGVVAAAAGAAFVGWQLGKWIGETTGATDAVGKFSAKIGEMVGLLPKGTAAQYDASRAAAKYNEAQQATGASTTQAADAVKQIEAAMAAATKGTGVYATGLVATKDKTKELAAATKAWNAAVKDVLHDMHKLAVENAADLQVAAGKRAEKTADAMLDSFNRRTDAERDAAKYSQDIEFERAEFAIEQAKRNGASWQQIYAMEKSLADARLQSVIDQAQLEFEVRTAWIDRTTAFGEAEYQALKTAHDLKIQGMVEKHVQAETMKRTELEHTHNVWLRSLDGIKAIARGLTDQLANGFVNMITKAQSFKEAFVSIWQSLKQSLLDIFSDILHSFIKGFLDGMMNAIMGRQGGFASAFQGIFSMGGGGGILGGGGGGGLLGKIPGLGGLFGGGGAAASGLFAAGGASSGLASGAAINATTAGLAGGGAGAGAGGAGATLTSLLTNPITIGVGAGLALTWAIWKKGLFRGGEEALKVSPRRDMFLRQFGDPANKGTGGGGWNLASALVQAGQGDGGGPLFRALQGADTVSKFESAQASIVSLLKRTGMEVHSFAQGGFIPPGVVTPAMLHGGSQGEVIVPLEKVMNSAVTVNWVVNAWDTAGVRTAMPGLIREFKMAMLLNQDGLMTANRRALEA